MTNHHWSFSISALQAQFGFRTLLVLNDFTALALALPALPAHELRQVGGGCAAGRCDRAHRTGHRPGCLGPAARWPRRLVPLQGEGGHVTLAGRTPRDRGARRLHPRYGHASAERAVCGQGLVDIHLALQTHR